MESTQQKLATIARLDNQFAIFGQMSQGGSRRPRYDFPALLAVPKSIPRPSVAEIIAETDSAVAEFVPAARSLFCLPEDWNLGPTRMTWELWNSQCHYIEGKNCLRFDFAHLICWDDESFPVAHEYGIYRNDPVIGQIATTDWRVHIRMTVAHELAHAVQCGLLLTNSPLHKGGRFYDGLGVYHSGHSPFFQEIYSRLREVFVNPLVPAASIGKKGAKTRIKTQPDLTEKPHPLVGVVINHPKHGRMEAVMVTKSAVYATSEDPNKKVAEVPIGRFKQLCEST